MGTRKTSSFDNHINLLDKKAIDGNIYRKVGSFISVCLLSVGNLVTLFFRFMAGHFFRVNNGEESNISESRKMNQESKDKEKGGEDFMDDNIERRMPAFSFKYQTQNFEEKIKKTEEEEDKDKEIAENSEKKDMDFMIAACINKYRFLSDKESLVSSESENLHQEDADMGILYAEDFLKPPLESIFVQEDDKCSDYTVLGSLYQKDRRREYWEEEKFNSMSSESNYVGEKDIRFVSEDISSFDFESDTESSSDGYSVKDLVYDSDIYGFLSDKDFGEEEFNTDRETSVTCVNKFEKANFESFYSEISDDVEETISAEKLHFPVEVEISMTSNSEQTSVENKFIGKLEYESELQIEFVEDSSDDELSSVKNGSARVDSFGEVHFVKDVSDSESKSEVVDTEEVGKIADDISNYDLTNFANASDVLEQKAIDCEACKGLEVVKKKSEELKTMDFDSEELDELWEHQDLIEQLKMELKRVRAAGLPTILEESESPRGIEDLKPFRIDEKLLREDPLDELQKFYKSYREGMRKFDILNYQKMYAMGFLQFKNPFHSMGAQRQLLPTIMTHLSQNLFSFCQKKSENDPSEKLVKDLQCDLETVYVGQTCLSWEFLRWQYEKFRELPESDPCRSHQYNQVADEFQQFQVLIQRFTENEQFQGPRLPNYVKQRCILRNLLQVPLMKEDCFMDNLEKENKYVITSEMMEDIMEEAIGVFWEFVKAEKNDAPPLLLKVLVENNIELQDPSDYLFMGEIQSNLQKKDKKLKQLLKTGNCIVKKFKKPQEDRSNQDLFFSQIDLKLVARVLRMSRISSDQLTWCQKKLSKISFSVGEVHREPSFLLFPC